MVIAGGWVDFTSAFSQSVTFAAAAGVLRLARSHGFTGAVSGFSQTGATTLNLFDIGFVGAGEATFSGTASGGVLTVTDGTNTANITLQGDYLASTFVASSDGAGGTDVVVQSAQTPLAAHFASAMATINGRGESAGLIGAHAVSEGWQFTLVAPRPAIA